LRAITAVRNQFLQFMLYLAVCCHIGGCVSPFHADGQSALARFEHEHVFQPARYPGGDWTPAGFEFEDVWFTAQDGTRLNGWYLPHENPRGTVLFAHGNGGNITHCAGLMRLLHDRHRLSVMIFDYRGYGKSDGDPSEEGIIEDSSAARLWLAQREQIAEGDVVLMGQSLGGGVVVDLAAEDGARGLVLVSTFTSLPDVAAHHYPLLPTRHLMQNRLDSAAKIGRYHGPLLQVHGDRDRVIPLAQGKRLFAAANEPKRFVVNSGADHNDPLQEAYHKALDEFLGSLPPIHPQPSPPRWRRSRNRPQQPGSSSVRG
jgi:fermentation-respiration switch protein FrsA (DUF1100 family)